MEFCPQTERIPVPSGGLTGASRLGFWLQTDGFPVPSVAVRGAKEGGSGLRVTRFGPVTPGRGVSYVWFLPQTDRFLVRYGQARELRGWSFGRRLTGARSCQEHSAETRGWGSGCRLTGSCSS